MTCFSCQKKEPQPLMGMTIRAAQNGWLIYDQTDRREGSFIGREWVAETPEQLSALVKSLLTEPVEA